MGIFLLPTTIQVGDGSLFFFWGDHSRVMGVTNRLAFTGPDGKYQLVISDGGLRGTLTANYRQDNIVRLDAEDARVESGVHVATFERLPMGIWRFTICDPLYGSAWTMNEVHAGVVPCRSCLHPVSTEPVSKDGIACENPDCFGSVRQLDWASLFARFDLESGCLSVENISFEPWRKALDTGRSAA